MTHELHVLLSKEHNDFRSVILSSVTGMWQVHEERMEKLANGGRICIWAKPGTHEYGDTTVVFEADYISHDTCRWMRSNMNVMPNARLIQFDVDGGKLYRADELGPIPKFVQGHGTYFCEKLPDFIEYFYEDDEGEDGSYWVCDLEDEDYLADDVLETEYISEYDRPWKRDYLKREERMSHRAFCAKYGYSAAVRVQNFALEYLLECKGASAQEKAEFEKRARAMERAAAVI